MIILTIALIRCGVYLIVHPLLVLSVDQVSSFARYTNKFGYVIIINLDDQASSAVSSLEQIICLILGLSANTTTTMFLFNRCPVKVVYIRPLYFK